MNRSLEETFPPAAEPTSEEAQLRYIIAQIQQDYQRQIKPYLDRLVRIESCKAPRPFIFPSGYIPPGIDVPE